MHAREAELTDPQHRLFLECSWQALEDAGYDPATFAGPIGVYAGCSIGSYLLRNVLGGRERIERFTSDYPVSDYPELLGCGYDFLATRVAYKLNLRGPAMTLQSACSTSLLAVAQACQALSFGQADMMLAGGVSITFPQRRGYAYQEGGMVSPDGHCRTFDAGANGTVFGDGAGVVVLKRLDDALAAGDSIYAVIRGFGTNNDGASKVGYTAPSSDGQLGALRAAYAMADVDPATVGFVECHGTATPLGDPIEYEALRKAFAGDDGIKRCALGSVKTNVGHLDIAAGITGLIKAALAVQNGRIPPTLHFTAPNPSIDLANGPFFVNTAVAEWPNGNALRRAGVSAFGVGGTNVHLVLEEAPARAQTPAADGSHLLVLSARSDAALAQARTNLAAHLRENPAVSLGNVARTLQSGRHAFDVRCALAAASLDEAAELLERNERIVSGRAGGGPPNVAFVFPGQGSQYPGMGRELYERIPAFRAAIDRCAEILRRGAGFELLDYLYRNDDAAGLTSTEIAQPAIFAIEYALAETLRRYGVVPVASAGHSVGEFVAATLAGVFSLEDGLSLVAERGRLMRGLPAGAMLVVRAGEADVRALLGSELDLAAVNAPGLSVVSGPAAAIERLEARLLRDGVMARRLHTSHAFHSAMMEPIVAPLTQTVAAATLRAPVAPYVSTLTGTWITPEEATSPSYWARHCREAVRFADAAQTLVDAGIDIILEVGPGATLTTFALQGAAKGGRASALPTLPTAEGAQKTDLATFHAALGRLWVAGAPLDWDAVAADRPGARIPLPTYPFERKHFWIERCASETERPAAPAAISPAPVATATAPAEPAHEGRQAQADAGEIGSQLIALLEDLSGESLAAADRGATFLELGFDSLALGRFAANVQTRLSANVTFRQLLNELPSVAALAAHIARSTPAPVASLAAPEKAAERAAPAAASPVEAFRVTPPANAEMTAAQRAHVDDLIARTVARTAKSKALTQRYRGVLADPRVAAGFRSEWKEMVYPITCVEAKGSRIRDVDGNEYIDILNGFGQTAFGHAPDFVVDAVAAQLRLGFAIGPQTQLAGEVAELFCELTGNERVTFCNTGSEAVMAALRVARTVTNRDRVVVFEGSYHGQFDEVLVKSARGSRRSLPVAAGIPNQAVANVTVLPYGEPESLAWIREHQNELAAVVVETVQSRHPSLRPQEFLRELRGITATSGSALVFDEVVTGFRMHPGGMQALFGIRADLATYGKVVGGGLPIGILAGSARFMDALDGGAWQYGDDSFPEVAPTFVAGTFVRHPLAMAAVLAVLRRCKAEGPGLQERIAERTQRLVARLNETLAARGVASRIESYGSLFYFNFTHEDRLAHLLHYHLRLRGIYVQEGFPCFLGTEHSDADVDAIVAAFTAGLDELQAVGILAPRAAVASTAVAVLAAPAGTPLTEEQTEIWLSAQVGDEASCAFNESVTVRLNGPLDEGAFVDAWDRIVARHDALRAAFGATGEAMTFAAPGPVGLRRWDLSARPAAARDVLLDGIVDSEARTPFDLAQGPLVRGHLIRLSSTEHAFVFTGHHIVCDGWSINVILSEMAAIYDDLARQREPSLAPALAFETYARRQAQRDPAQLAAVESYWLAEFATPPAPLQLPTDRARPSRKSYRGATRTAHVAKDAYQAVKKAGARNGCTLFVTLLAAFNALAGRLADQDDVTVGIPAAGQSLLDGEILVGHCVDFLPVRAQRTAQTTFAAFLGEMKRRVLDAYDHQQYTLGTLVRKLALERDRGRVPLAEIQFNLERLPEDLQFAGVTARVEPNPKAFVNFDLFLNVVESEAGLRLDCDYNADLFDAATIDRWLSYYEAFLAHVARDADRPIAAIDLVSAEERGIIERINDTAAEYPRAQTVDGLVAAAAAAAPGKIALHAADGVLTYDALQRRVARLANVILARAGAPGRRVAVCVDRSTDLVAVLLGTLAAGCAYVPLDSAHPAARLRGIIEDAGAAAIVTDGSLDPAAIPAGVATIDLRADANAIDSASPVAPALARNADDPAYVIYTSGSTGRPKGVEVAHRSVVNLLNSMTKRPGLSADDVLLAVTTVSFDIAALELFLPLVTGATVSVAARDEAADPRELAARLGAGITVMQATPALWQLLVSAGFASRPGLTMLSGGEPLTRELADRLLAGGGTLWNMYGPTETTIWSTCARVEPGAEPITVGTPIDNTQCYVLDEHDRTVPVGTGGQLHIAGDGVALGYVGRPELTAERFVPNPFGPGRMYRTGDAARVTPQGAIAVLGRVDHQVKLRGFRIELGEIEAVVRAKTGVDEVVVVLREDAPGDRRLVCYYVAPPAPAHDAANLRTLAAEDLPDYMLPAAWVRLERMPLSVAGKIDRAALPAPDPAAPAAAFSEPGTPTEIALARIWSEVLRVERVGLDDDFFALGGDSIHLFQITARANQSGLRLAAKDLLRNSTLGALARRLDEIARTATQRNGAHQSAGVSPLRPNGQAPPLEPALHASERS